MIKILNKKINSAYDKEINKKFINTKNDNINLKCNVLKSNFYLDAYNYFPITDEYYSFSDIFTWGDMIKYQNFYTKKFSENFEINKNNFKNLSDIFVLGSSSQDNYYRNIVTFLPRIFYNPKNKSKIAIHRNTSNKLRIFIKLLCKQMGLDINFVYLDDTFYKFNNSEIPQFFKKEDSIKILNKLTIKNNKKREKIYVIRRNANYRNLLNENDVIEKLIKLDFAIIDLNDFSILDQIKLFSNAKTIVSTIGSGLTNIVFCQPGTKVFEISPKFNFEYESVFSLRYKSICSILNLDYVKINADSVDLDKNSKTNNIISSKVLSESNYYKNLIIKLDSLNIIKN